MTKGNVAIVDDKSPFAVNLRMFLSNRGYEARCFAHDDELLAWVRQHDAPGVVLFDAIPALNRFETLKALKASYPQAETIVMSAFGQHSREVDGERPDGLRYVNKPETPETFAGSALDAAIASALERQRLEPPLRPVESVDAQANPNRDDCIWGTGDQMRSIARTIEQIADSDVTVLLRGESGVGKGLVAQALHQRSTRRAAAFVKVNCAALPGELLESELFGHERGAFTGAVSTRIGKFEQADGGTLLLDEIGEMKPALQAKLLHVLQDGEFTKLGSNRRIRSDVRVVAATNCNLERMMASGDFREDLYFRLGVFELTVPPLRERCDEIPRLLETFTLRYARQYGRRLRPLSPEIRQLFTEYDWPGNVRELENMIKRIVILQDEATVAREIRQKLQQSATTPAAAATTLSGGMGLAAAKLAGAGARGSGCSTQAELVDAPDAKPAGQGVQSLISVARAAAMCAERAAILQTLSKVNWNRRKAAQALGVSYKTLLNKMKLSGISSEG